MERRAIAMELDEEAFDLVLEVLQDESRRLTNDVAYYAHRGWDTDRENAAYPLQIVDAVVRYMQEVKG